MGSLGKVRNSKIGNLGSLLRRNGGNLGGLGHVGVLVGRTTGAGHDIGVIQRFMGFHSAWQAPPEMVET